MQAAPIESPWPKRLLIIGIVMSLFGITIFALMSGTIATYLDPRESADVEVKFGDAGIVNLSEGCWVIHVVTTDAEFDISLNKTDGSSIGEGITETCRSDFSAQAADGTSFTKVESYQVDEDSQVVVSIDCKEGSDCSDLIVYMHNDFEATMSLMGDPMILLSGSLCCLGFLLVPFGWMLMVINRGKATQVQIIQNQMTGAMTPPEDEIPLAQGEMLTTNDIYQMMRGNLPDQEESEIPPPFAGVEVKRTPISKKSTGGSSNKASNYTAERPPEDESWKKWDES